MSILAHLLATDAKRLRLATILWIVVAAVETATIYARPFAAWDPRSAETVAFANMLLWLAGAVLGFALISLVVHAHPAVGSEAFWMTRPFPPRTLAASKLLMLAALFAGVPVVMELALMAVHDVPATDMLRVALQTSLYRSLLLAGLLVVAVLTPNFARYAIATGAVLLAVAMIPAIVMLVDSWQPARRTAALVVSLYGNMDMRMPAVGRDPSPLVAAALTAVAAGLAAVFVQYAVRSWWRSLLVGGLGFAVALGVPATGRWGVLREDVPAPQWAHEASALQFTGEPSAVRFDPPPASDKVAATRTARVPVRLTPAAPGWIATVRTAAATLHAGDGEHRALAGGGSGSVVAADESGAAPWQESLRHVLGVSRVVLPFADSTRTPETHIALHVPAPILQRGSNGSVDLVAEVRVDLTRLEVVAAMPFQSDGRFDDGAYHFVVDEARLREPELQIRARVTRVATILDRRPRPMYLYYLRNRGRGEAVHGSWHFARHHTFLPIFGWSWATAEADPNGFSTNPLVVNFMQRGFGGRDAEQPVPIDIDREWVEGAELVIVRATHDGSVRRTLEVRGIPLAGS